MTFLLLNYLCIHHVIYRRKNIKSSGKVSTATKKKESERVEAFIHYSNCLHTLVSMQKISLDLIVNVLPQDLMQNDDDEEE